MRETQIYLRFMHLNLDTHDNNIGMKDYDSHRIQITYRMFTPIGANGKLLTLNFHIDTGAATSSQNN